MISDKYDYTATTQAQDGASNQIAEYINNVASKLQDADIIVPYDFTVTFNCVFPI